jgi:hypothetical protein
VTAHHFPSTSVNLVHNAPVEKQKITENKTHPKKKKKSGILNYKEKITHQKKKKQRSGQFN